jgi:gliding motility-associated-like protein
VQDANGCLAISLSGSKNAIVYKVPVAFAGADTVVCGPVVNLKAVPTLGTGSWTFPSGVAISSALNPVTTAVIDSTQFANGFVSKIFTWEETNWQCTSADDISVKFYQRVSNIFAGPDDTTFYSNTYEFHLVNDPPVNAWETGIWTRDNTEVDVTGGIITDLKEGDNSFLWTIYNGIMNNGILSEGCMISDALNIKVKPVFVPQGFSPNSDSYNNTFIISGLDLPHQRVVLKIFNSVGTEVFSTHSTPEDQSTWTDWDGKSSRGTYLPEGTYYYLLTIGSDRFKGFVILKRY